MITSQAFDRFMFVSPNLKDKLYCNYYNNDNIFTLYFYWKQLVNKLLNEHYHIFTYSVKYVTL